MKLRYAMAVAMGLVVAATSFGQTAQNVLKVGDAAPKVVVSKWVKGTPVTNFEKGKLYVVEFWATWCGPCKESIPHLTELAKKFPDVDFVGVSVWESDQKAVEPFVKDMGDKMSYNIAMDQLPEGAANGNMGEMAKGWMQAAGQNGIPTAFIVDKEGKIAWIGHPMALEGPLSKVVNGTYSAADYEKARKDQELALKMTAYDSRLQEAMGSNDDKSIVSILDEMMADSNSEIQAQGGMMKFSFLLGKKQYDDAYVVGDKLVEMFKKDSDRLNSIAWAIVDPQGGVEKKNLDLAMKAATRSVDLDKNSANLDTLARVYFVKGDKAKALQLEKEALKLAPDSDKKSYEDTIKEYGG